MKKIYLQPATNGWNIGTQTQLLANSFVDNKINVDTTDMDMGDGSDGVKADRGWDGIWSD